MCGGYQGCGSRAARVGSASGQSSVCPRPVERGCRQVRRRAHVAARGTAPAVWRAFPALVNGLDRARGRGPGAGGPCSQLL